jgi:selenocysteine lyase/cysteine desulfurase
MVTVRLPISTDPDLFKERLYNDYRLEVLAHYWQGKPFLRVSFQAYNQQTDLDILLRALNEVLA